MSYFMPSLNALSVKLLALPNKASLLHVSKQEQVSASSAMIFEPPFNIGDDITGQLVAKLTSLTPAVGCILSQMTYATPAADGTTTWTHNRTRYAQHDQHLKPMWPQAPPQKLQRLLRQPLLLVQASTTECLGAMLQDQRKLYQGSWLQKTTAATQQTPVACSSTMTSEPLVVTMTNSWFQGHLPSPQGKKLLEDKVTLL